MVLLPNGIPRTQCPNKSKPKPRDHSAYTLSFTHQPPTTPQPSLPPSINIPDSLSLFQLIKPPHPYNLTPAPLLSSASKARSRTRNATGKQPQPVHQRAIGTRASTYPRLLPEKYRACLLACLLYALCLTVQIVRMRGGADGVGLVNGLGGGLGWIDGW